MGTEGAVHIVDTLLHRVQIFNTNGTLRETWGSYGSGQENLDSPQGIAIDATGRVWVTDSGNHRIISR